MKPSADQPEIAAFSTPARAVRASSNTLQRRWKIARAGHCKHWLCLLALIAGSKLLPAAALSDHSGVDLVDTLIGTGSGGNTFPGPCLPYGFVKLSPDTDKERAGGYDPTGKIRCFSHNHISGMGGPKYGNVGLMPVIGAVDVVRLGHLSAKADEFGRPGYYRVNLTDYKILVELTATMHAGMHRYTFPKSESAHILVDAGATLHGTGQGWNSSIPTGGQVCVSPDDREVRGYNSFVGGRGSGAWKIYFVAKCDTPFTSYATWLDGTMSQGSACKEGASIGACLDFATSAGQVIQMKVGLSFISVEQARKNLEHEIPDEDFDRVRQAAVQAWGRELNKIQVEGGSDSDKKVFYTGLYHTMLMPTDFTEENPYFNDGRPYYDDFLCIYDLFRVVMPLHVLIDTPKTVDMLNSLVDVYRHDGWLPDSRCAVTYDQVQCGTNVDLLFAEAYAKNVKGVDYATAVRGMIKNADTETPDPRHFGRKGLSEYLAKGYVVAVPESNSVSRTLDYVYDDYGIYLLCRGLGMKTEAQRYKDRALWYRNVWDSRIGFMRGRNSDGSWLTPFEPGQYEAWGKCFYEGTAYQWSYDVPHDVGGLVSLHGGESAFLKKLDEMCATHFDYTNEPDILNPYLFAWVGRPDKTADYVRAFMRKYDSSVDGIPGNDDSGTMSGWFVWSAMGLYPVGGQDFYLIGTPLFTKVTIHMSNGRDLVINAPSSTRDNRYVQSAKFNGRVFNQAYLRQSDLANGAVLDLAMGSSASSWANATRPPSFSDSLR